MGDITVLIQRAHAGDTDANAELFTAVYADLKRVAQAGAPIKCPRTAHHYAGTRSVFSFGETRIAEGL
jgi:hypothetical protein